MIKQRFLLLFILVALYATAVNALSAVTVLSPVSGQNVSGTLLLNATTDTNASNATFMFMDTNGNFVLNHTITNASSASVYTNASFNTSLLADGFYNLTVNSTDGVDSVTNTSVSLVRIDNGFPVVTMISASMNTTNTTPRISYNVTDGTYTSLSCIMYFNGTAYNSTTAATSIQINVTPNASVADGFYAVSVNCTDGLSHMNATSVINVTIDTTAPVVTFVTPANGSSKNTSFVLNVSTDTQATRVQYRIENGSNASHILVNYTNMTNSSTFQSWNATVNASALAQGNYTIRINATDALNNTATSAYILVIIDTTAPVISAFSCNDITQDDAQDCTCTATDNGQTWGANLTTSISSASNNIGHKTVSCTVTDAVGYTDSESAEYDVTDGDDSDGSSSSGSPPAKQTSVNISSSPVSSYLQQDKSSQIVLSKLSEKHSAKVTRVDNTSADVLFSSTPQLVTLKVGDSKRVDLNGDGTYDLSVLLKSVFPLSKRVQLEFMEVSEPVATQTVQTPAQPVTQPVVQAPAEEAVQQPANQPVEPRETPVAPRAPEAPVDNDVTGVALVIIGLAVVALLVGYFFHHKKRHHRAH